MRCRALADFKVSARVGGFLKQQRADNKVFAGWLRMPGAWRGAGGRTLPRSFSAHRATRPSNNTPQRQQRLEAAKSQ